MITKKGKLALGLFAVVAIVVPIICWFMKSSLDQPEGLTNAIESYKTGLAAHGIIGSYANTSWKDITVAIGRTQIVTHSGTSGIPENTHLFPVRFDGRYQDWATRATVRCDFYQDEFGDWHYREYPLTTR